MRIRFKKQIQAQKSVRNSQCVYFGLTKMQINIYVHFPRNTQAEESLKRFLNLRKRLV